jgi:hypothetical protein
MPTKTEFDPVKPLFQANSAWLPNTLLVPAGPTAVGESLLYIPQREPLV